MKATDLTPENRFVGMLVGPSGSGKTVAACSFPHPIYVFDFDGRIRGLLGANFISREGIEYDYYPPRELGLIDRIQKKCELFEMFSEQSKYDMLPKTVLLDSLTSETFAMLTQCIPLTHSKDGKGKGKFIGTMAMAGPEDYGFEAQSTYNILSFFRSVRIPNIIVSAHIVQKYGKLDPDNLYAESVVVGEKLSVRDKIGENSLIYFDHVFRFDKRESAGSEHYYVKFRGDLPIKTAYSELPYGEIDITRKSLYDTIMNYTKQPSPA